MFEKICHTLGGQDGRYHQKVGIHISEIDLISGVAYELRQKHTLGPAVALSERVQSIGDAIEINDFLYELVMGQILEIVAAPQPFKNQLRLTFDVFSRGKLGSLLADVHGADFAQPIHTGQRRENGEWLCSGRSQRSLPAERSAIPHILQMRSRFRSHSAFLHRGYQIY